MADEETSQPAAELPRGVRRVARGWEIDLDYPIECGGQEVTKVTMRRPNVGNVENMARDTDDDEKDSAGLVALNNLIARLCGITEEEVRTVDIEDWSRMLEVIRPHLEKLQRGRLI
jgi:hypothetical protein